mgnify:CR=1 FL=1
MMNSQISLGFQEVEELNLANKNQTIKNAKSNSKLNFSIEEIAEILEGDPNYRVTKRLTPIRQYPEIQGAKAKVLIIDTETTGLTHKKDKIIELAMILVEVNLSLGKPTGKVKIYNGLEDPGIPLTEEIKAITGINDLMLRDQKIDNEKVQILLKDVDLIIAHNASFDRPFCENRLADFGKYKWGCSWADIDWKKEGHTSAKLEYLGQDMGFFYDAHRAEMDCHALLEVLCRPLANGMTGLSNLLSQREISLLRIQANGAPFEAKDLLKARGYRWQPENRVWQIDLVDESSLQIEKVWLKKSVYRGRSAQIQLETLDSTFKYSQRPGQITLLQL